MAKPPVAEIWLNGGFLPASAARIDPADRGFLLGDGLFETLAATNGAVQDFPAHFARLQAGAALLRLKIPFAPPVLDAALHEILLRNRLPQAALRLTLTRGPGPRGVLPPVETHATMLITAGPKPALTPVTLVTSATIRRDESSPLSRIKSLNYLPNILARQEAAERGADDALLLNHAGRVAEASAANILVLKDGTWLTPKVTDGALPGIARGRFLAAGRIREATLAPADLHGAEALCLLNVFGSRPVVSLDGTAFSLREPGQGSALDPLGPKGPRPP